jgi:biotin-dependent carboxylase-like uncharacterized protein
MIEVLEPGLLSSVQDLGRRGLRALGVPVGGALDAFSLRAANGLVGNAEGAAVLEYTLVGPRLRFLGDAVIALCGGHFEARVDEVSLPHWRPLRICSGTELKLGRAQRGARGYLAIAGGLDVPEVLGAHGALPGSGFPGLAGRALATGDRLDSGQAGAIGRDWPQAARGVRMAPWWANPTPTLELDQPAEVGLLPGRDTLADPELLFEAAWKLSARSGRMGLRLEGPPLALAEPAITLSEPVTPGTLQLPPEAGPILLMAEAQTVGGYPRIGHVALGDLPRLAQLVPGEALRFRPVCIEQALESLRRMEQHLQKLRMAAQQVMGE